ncbi:hypothetical protein MY04_4007 [Flammeovirga sp. MY04]|uniref:hypothetical protein n=1 Tax=Flammeovirga sp. MY04 TaxID=1191459 RepID=UPI000806430B|nr:hypothetical protein [Flammeovirga sp. MY04]ANQ51351.1 hypothetical protein MY04_4007 [Flammeovirga sp. MY04]
MKNLRLLFSGLFIFISSMLFAQNGEKEIEEVIRNVVERTTFNNDNLDKINTIFDTFRPDAIINVTQMNVDGSRKHRVLRKSEYKGIYVSQYQHSLERNSELKIHEIRVQGNIGVASFSLSYELKSKANDKIVSKGYESMVATFVKQKEGWMVMELNISDIESEKYQGKCSCELYKNPNTGQVIAKVSAPKGDRFENDLNNIYKRKKGGITYFMVQGIVFEWADMEKIWTLDASMNRVDMLGKAKNDDDAVMLILGFVYQNECTELKLNK